MHKLLNSNFVDLEWNMKKATIIISPSKDIVVSRKV